MIAPALSLVIGGAASGKSAWAEGFVRTTGMAKVYIATAEAHDAEMRAKVALHRQARAGHGWRTVETPYELPRALAELEAEEIALVDCATFWLANLMGRGDTASEATETLVEVLSGVTAPVVVVTNELGHGIVPADPATRAFREAHGRMNIALAEAADLAVMVTAGMPMILKGRLV